MIGIEEVVVVKYESEHACAQCSMRNGRWEEMAVVWTFC